MESKKPVEVPDKDTLTRDNCPSYLTYCGIFTHKTSDREMYLLTSMMKQKKKDDIYNLKLIALHNRLRFQYDDPILYKIHKYLSINPVYTEGIIVDVYNVDGNLICSLNDPNIKYNHKTNSYGMPSSEIIGYNKISTPIYNRDTQKHETINELYPITRNYGITLKKIKDKVCLETKIPTYKISIFSEEGILYKKYVTFKIPIDPTVKSRSNDTFVLVCPQNPGDKFARIKLIAKFNEQ